VWSNFGGRKPNKKKWKPEKVILAERQDDDGGFKQPSMKTEFVDETVS
jgi:hypothetical protein